MDSIKVLIADDSAFMRKLISDFLEEAGNIEVIATARNGKDAFEKVKQLKPDVVTLDVEMPVMNGLEALGKIMKDCPTPVVMLSSTTKSNAENTLHAMQLGAFDFIEKPSGAISLDLHKVKEEMITKVTQAAKANMKELTRDHPMDEKQGKQESTIPELSPSLYEKGNKPLVCIGTSTGGPRALQAVLSRLPKSINAPILIVQHMPPGFTKSLADRLDSLSEIRVKEAEDGELIRAGTAYIAPGGYHLTVKKIGRSLAIQLDQSPQVNGHRPSVDLLFQSVARVSGYRKVAVIMTGMGSDGAEGLKSLKSTGDTRLIAESNDTAIVFGMPKAAIATGLVDDVAHLDQIASTIMRRLEQ